MARTNGCRGCSAKASSNKTMKESNSATKSCGMKNSSNASANAKQSSSNKACKCKSN